MAESGLRLTPLQRTILGIAVRAGPLSRAELARRAASSRSRLSPEIAQLLADGVLVEAGHDVSSGGRPGALLRPGGADVAVLAGADIDSDRAAVTVTTLDGTVIARDELSLRANADPRRTLERTASMLEGCLPEECGPLLAVGLSVPGDIDPAGAAIESAPTLPRWVGVRLADLFAARMGVRTFVDNDVNVLAVAEAAHPRDLQRLGASFLVVKISSGIGCGIVVDGTVFRGSHGFAGDIGHIAADPTDPTRCACGNRGCLEALAAAPAILRAAGATTLDKVGEAARSGDPEVAALLRTVGSHLGLVLAGLVSFFNPEAVIVRSGIPGGEELLLNAVRQRIYERALPTSTHALQVLPSRFGEDAGALGAAILAGQGYLGLAGAVAQARPVRRALDLAAVAAPGR